MDSERLSTAVAAPATSPGSAEAHHPPIITGKAAAIPDSALRRYRTGRRYPLQAVRRDQSEQGGDDVLQIISSGGYTTLCSC